MADKKLKVEIVGDASSLKRAAGDADGALGKLGKGALAAGAGLATFGVAAFSMASAAAEDEKAAAALAKTLENSAGATREQIAATEDWITAQGKALGISDDQLRPALDSLVRGTGDVAKAQELAALAMDISAGTGKDLTAVSDSLGKAYNGQLGPLKKLDPALADLIAAGASADGVFADLARTFEGQAGTAAETTAGKLAIAKLQFSEMQEEIGAKLIPILASLASFAVDTLIPAIERMVVWVETNWPKFRAAIESGIQSIRLAWDTYGKPVFDEIVGAVNGFIGIVQGLWSTFGDTILGYIRDTWGNIKTVFEGAFKLIEGVWNTFKGLFTGDWGLMWDGIKQVIDGAWTVIRGLFSQALDGMKATLSLAWDAMKATVGTAIDGIVTFFAELPGKILAKLANLGSDLMDLAGKALGVGVGFLGGLGSKLGELMGWFQELPGKIVGWIGDIGQQFFDLGKKVVQRLIDGLANMLTSLKNKVGDILGALNPLDHLPDLNPFSGGGGGSGTGVGITRPGGDWTVGRPMSASTATTYNSFTIQADATSDPVMIAQKIFDVLDAGARAGVRPSTLVLA